MGKKHKKVKNRSITEIRAALNDLIEIFEVKDGEKEIRKMVVKNGKLQVDYENED